MQLCSNELSLPALYFVYKLEMSGFGGTVTASWVRLGQTVLSPIIHSM